MAMAPVKLNTGAGVLIRTMKQVFFLTMMILHPVISNDCSDERNCTFTKEIERQRGQSVELPLNTSKTISDLCMWDNSRWKFIWDLIRGSKYDSSFKEDVSVVDKTFRLSNVSKNASGTYRILDNEGSCVAWIKISVWDSEMTTHLPSSSSPGLRSPSLTTNRPHQIFLLLFLVVLLFTL
ncbi:uncharacterized protein LOC143834511 [Paroedura picta]|uniref:uncharacterized protein LOC143834511 n=1 Tax=Paroedura picta TaxID=143630 RepID=UPI004055C2BA